MFDVTNNKSFESAREWKQELDSKVELPNGEKVPCVLLGNKVSRITRIGKIALVLFIHLFIDTWDGLLFNFC